MVDFILASASPRRHALVRLLQQAVRVQVADVDESSVVLPDPAANVIETARLKAEAVAAESEGEVVIIAADTTVALDGEMLGKPAGPVEAALMLRRLRNRVHQVHTGIVVLALPHGESVETVSTTQVVMRDYGDGEIVTYVASGDPLDKAGAYAIQNASFHPVAKLDGCFTGVVGLSLCRLAQALGELGIPVALPLANHNTERCSTCLALMDGLF